jgi:hypothetical protein
LSFRLDRALLLAIESVLREEERVASFDEEAIRLEFAGRQGFLDPTTHALVSISGSVEWGASMPRLNDVGPCYFIVSQFAANHYFLGLPMLLELASVR